MAEETPDPRRAPLPADLDRLLHDLRGPLNAVVMHLEVLKRLLGEDPTGRPSVQSIQGELERLAAMLPVAMSICALEMGPPRRLALRSVVEAALDADLRKQVSLDPEPWPDVDGDEALLTLAVRHLAQNALEAVGTEGDVNIGVEGEQDGLVTLTVRDTGAGFRMKNASARIRLMASGKPGHLGIGLLIAQRVARLHGGSITFGHATDGGAVVRMSVRALLSRARVGDSGERPGQP